MSNAVASVHSLNDTSSLEHMKMSSLSPRGSTTRDAVVSLDDLTAEARERLEVEQESAPGEDAEPSEDEENCIICLQTVVDRVVLINCAHDRMCFVCIKQWTGKSCLVTVQKQTNLLSPLHFMPYSHTLLLSSISPRNPQTYCYTAQA